MAAARLPRLLIFALAVLLIMWAAALGLLWTGRHGNDFPAAETIDSRFSARPGLNLTRADLAPDRLPAVLDGLAAGRHHVRPLHPALGRDRAGEGAVRLGCMGRRGGRLLRGIPRSSRSRSSTVRPPGRAAPPTRTIPSRRLTSVATSARFARAVAERYGDTFTYYQVWDEPNIAPHWGAKGADPVDYLGLLREAAVNIRAADPGAQIVAAALAPTTEGGGANLSDVAYLDRLYALGGAGLVRLSGCPTIRLLRPGRRRPRPCAPELRPRVPPAPGHAATRRRRNPPLGRVLRLGRCVWTGHGLRQRERVAASGVHAGRIRACRSGVAVAGAAALDVQLPGSSRRPCRAVRRGDPVARDRAGPARRR